MTKSISIWIGCLIALVFACRGAEPSGHSDAPEFTAGGQLNFPKHYREWVFLSSGLGMTYGPLGAQAGAEHPPFDNVFVNRTAYQSFLESGHWPDQTVLVLEIRASRSKASINQSGHFQAEPLAVEVHVKDEKRFPRKWAFFGFEGGRDTASPIPTSASCYSCHEKHGGVDTTFVQFYPTLLKTAGEKGTFKAAAADTSAVRE